MSTPNKVMTNYDHPTEAQLKLPMDLLAHALYSVFIPLRGAGWPLTVV